MIDQQKVKLPELPDIEEKWGKIPRRATVVPFGYKVSDDDPDILDPIPEELELLEMAREHTKNYSYRSVAAWLSETSGRYISHTGLKKRLEYERSNRKKAQSYHLVAKRLQKTLQALRKIEEERVGSLKRGSRAREFPEFDPGDTETKPD